MTDYQRVNYVLFDITNRCNLNCKHCYKENNVTDKELTVDFCVQTFDELNSLCGTNSVVISGGEPTMYRELNTLLNEFKDRNAFIKLNTNGIIFPDITGLENYEGLHIQISLDGYDLDSYEKIRNSDAFNIICDNAKLYKAAGIDVYFRATITRENIKRYTEFVRLSKETGIRLVMRPMLNTGGPMQEDLANSFSELLEWRKDVIENGYISYIGEDFITCTNCPLVIEDSYISVLSVSIDGDVYPCTVLRSDIFKLGNLIDSSVEDVIKGFEGVQNNIRKALECDACEKCGFRKSYGNGNCIVFCCFANKSCNLELLKYGDIYLDHY